MGCAKERIQVGPSESDSLIEDIDLERVYQLVESLPGEEGQPFLTRVGEALKQDDISEEQAAVLRQVYVWQMLRVAEAAFKNMPQPQ